MAPPDWVVDDDICTDDGTVIGVLDTPHPQPWDNAQRLCTVDDPHIQDVEELTQAHERLRDEQLLIPVVERVLLEYGIDVEVIDPMLEDMEAVDAQLRDE